MSKLYYLLFSIAVIVSIFYACSKTPSMDSQVQDYRSRQLKNVYKHGILPSLGQYSQQLQAFKQSANAYAQTPTAAQMAALRDKWKKVASAWAKCELYNVGAINDQFLFSGINFWPTNAQKINASLRETAKITPEYVKAKGVDVIGLAAIEFLLFEERRSDAAMVTQFSTNARRFAYLSALIVQLQGKSEKIIAAWQAYQTAFESSLQNGIMGSQNKIFNAWIAQISLLVDKKIGKPLGKGKVPANGQLTEAYRSRYSNPLMRASLQTIENLYTGTFNTASTSTIGFDDVLHLIHRSDLAEAVKKQIKACMASAAALPQPLSMSITTHRQAVETLYKNCRDLLILIKVDVSSALSITVTFTDQDGD